MRWIRKLLRYRQYKRIKEYVERFGFDVREPTSWERVLIAGHGRYWSLPLAGDWVPDLHRLLHTMLNSKEAEVFALMHPRYLGALCKMPIECALDFKESGFVIVRYYGIQKLMRQEDLLHDSIDSFRCEAIRKIDYASKKLGCFLDHCASPNGLVKIDIYKSEDGPCLGILHIELSTIDDLMNQVRPFLEKSSMIRALENGERGSRVLCARKGRKGRMLVSEDVEIGDALCLCPDGTLVRAIHDKVTTNPHYDLPTNLPHVLSPSEIAIKMARMKRHSPSLTEGRKMAFPSGLDSEHRDMLDAGVISSSIHVDVDSSSRITLRGDKDLSVSCDLEQWVDARESCLFEFKRATSLFKHLDRPDIVSLINRLANVDDARKSAMIKVGWLDPHINARSRAIVLASLTVAEMVHLDDKFLMDTLKSIPEALQTEFGLITGMPGVSLDAAMDGLPVFNPIGIGTQGAKKVGQSIDGLFGLDDAVIMDTTKPWLNTEAWDKRYNEFLTQAKYSTQTPREVASFFGHDYDEERKKLDYEIQKAKDTAAKSIRIKPMTPDLLDPPIRHWPSGSYHLDAGASDDAVMATRYMCMADTHLGDWTQKKRFLKGPAHGAMIFDEVNGSFDRLCADLMHQRTKSCLDWTRTELNRRIAKYEPKMRDKNV